jgi:hypothetical protein
VQIAKRVGCPEDHLGIKNLIKKIPVNKETSKGWVCDNFPRQFHFFLGAIHEQHKFKHLKNLMEKFVKFGAMKSICLFFSVII